MNWLSEQSDDKIFSKLGVAYVCVNPEMKVLKTSDDLKEFGFEPIPLGSDVTDYLDFMVGIDASVRLQLPMVSSPSGMPLSVDLFPEENSLLIMFVNASNYYQQRQLLQQHANDNELLLNEQKKLMLELESAQQELKAKNIALEEAGRLQRSFLSGVSHEFRTPLSSIIGYTNLLNRDIELMKKQQPESAEYLSAIRRSSRHLLSLVENLLDHGKFDSTEIIINPKPIDLFELFEDVNLLLKPISETKSIDLVVKHNVLQGQYALLDDSRLRQCLINIVGNAIKFTDEGSVLLEAQWYDDQLKICVTDTGIGISEEHLQKIYMPFWQAPDTGKAGTGLGLTITKRIIELMGGVLEIKSITKGNADATGTTVEFNLIAPVFTKNVDNEVKVARDLHVLLVEDDDDVAALVSFLLDERGVKVDRVDNGALAAQKVSEITFDIILMDLHMPVLGGYDAIKMIRDSGDRTPIIIMSASPIESEQAKAKKLGVDAYLTKPVDIDDVLEIADQVIQ